MINGNEYAFEDIEIVMLGRPLIGFSGIEYTAKKESTYIHGRGAKASAIGRGQETCSGTLTLLQSEVEAIQRQLPKGVKITDIHFNITVAYAPLGGVITIDHIKEAHPEEIKKGMKTNDGNMTVDIPFKALDIIYNV